MSAHRFSRGALVVACLSVLAFVGCKEDRPKRVAASYSTVTKPTFHPVPKLDAQAQQLPVGTDGVPTEEDYEARAESTITDANREAQLTALENEMPF